MSGREQAIREIVKRETESSSEPWKAKESISIAKMYGENVFNDAAMQKYLTKEDYQKLKKIIKVGGKIDEKLARAIAKGVRTWAMKKGATHYTHWFQPMTGSTAEKHDSFLSFDDNGMPIDKLSGKNLSQGEPDASSFPSGGIRATFEARGYTAWDASSPIYLVEHSNGATVVIPTIFLSYTGEALDKKTPLLRSIEAVNKAAVRMLKIFGNKTVTRVISTVGPEQEYFLIDRSFFYRRPDLLLTGRTLFGASSPKGQQMEDHYFGSIKERIISYMQEVEYELFKLGIPAKTRHNEVAPAQFEIAPIFEDSNIATDHNHIVMETMKKTAVKYNFALLVHEKPFAGVNGSGKHNNWSMSDSNGNNLLEPGQTPHDNLQFLTFLTAVIKGVYKYSDVLRASIASAGNDHRLGANEAPPAIISVFLGEQLDRVLNNLENNKKTEYSDKQIIDLGISKLPVISKDNTDRNRTSPFAFTGNKFEFRAVGSSMSIAPANYTINTVVATILNEFADVIEANIKKGMDLNKAVMEVILPAIKESKPIRFEGNNYDPAWEVEAAKRGLPNKKTTPAALADMVSEKNIAIFVKNGVFSKREIESRYHIYLETYTKLVNIEAETAIMMSKTMILPAVIKYQGELSASINSAVNAGVDKASLKGQMDLLNGYSKMIGEFQVRLDTLEKNLNAVQAISDVEKQAGGYCDKVMPAMFEIRKVVDDLEEQTSDDNWPMPKYREMLFIY